MRGLTRYRMIGATLGLIIGLALIHAINHITAAMVGVPPA